MIGYNEANLSVLDSINETKKVLINVLCDKSPS